MINLVLTVYVLRDSEWRGDKVIRRHSALNSALARKEIIVERGVHSANVPKLQELTSTRVEPYKLSPRRDESEGHRDDAMTTEQ